MKKLIKTIDGMDCAIFAIKNHQRVFVGLTTLVVEIYQNITKMNTLSQCKTYEFSLIIGDSPELSKSIRPDFLNNLSHFDIKMLLKRKDDIFVPFEFAGLERFTIESHGSWVFESHNYELTKKLIEF